MCVLMGVEFITEAQGQEVATTLGASYIETSTDVQSYTEVFEKAVRIALGNQFIGMRNRLKFVDAIFEEEKQILESEHKAVNLALWRGEPSETQELSTKIANQREVVNTWEAVRKEVATAAKADPTEQEDAMCVVM
eukprot:c5798_g1_i2.p2 GENE.c5798_g1_i2~~c5798_g1_i2.p2  ORF type:complete len:136 (+),score=52.92 c5798_g1_i2:518-925(+)